MRPPRLIGVLALALVLSFSLSMTSCGGGSGGEGELVLVGFNLPNISGIPLNQPLIFTFSGNVDPASITPDTLRVIGDPGPLFEQTVVDGNLVARLPTIPVKDDFSDAGLQPGTTYTVSMPVFPSPNTIRSPGGNVLVRAETFSFTTTTSFTFIETRRSIVHGLAPSQGGLSDDEGCLQNGNNALFVAPGIVQTGSGPGASLLCLANEGAPRVVAPSNSPTHNMRDVGRPSADPQFVGQIELPTMRLRLNEPLNPLTVVPYVPTLEQGVNVQLWRVAQKDGTAITPEQIATNQPQVVQTSTEAEIILVASRPVLQGIYVIILTPQIQDLAGNALVVTDDPDPATGDYTTYDGNPNLPPGWRTYFRTLETPDTALAIQEAFSTNIGEWGDLQSGTMEPGIFTLSTPTTNTMDPIPAIPVLEQPNPNFTLAGNGSECGQTTTCHWNNGLGTGYRFLNLASLSPNADADNGAGVLKAVWQPYLGSGGDGALNTANPPFSAGGGDSLGLNTDTGSQNGDGVYEYVSFNLQAGDTISVSGSKPLLILCQGDFTVDGTISLNGTKGGPGMDSDGSTLYTNTGAAPVGGPGGEGAAGGGIGGAGNDPVNGPVNGGDGFAGALGQTLFGDNVEGTTVPSVGGTGGDNIQVSGSGGGYGTAGGDGADSTAANTVAGGQVFGTAAFLRAVTRFQPDRGYFSASHVTGGNGGAGGGAEDDTAANEAGDNMVNNGDDGGAGGGGAGGGIKVISGGTITVNGSITANGGAGGDTYARADQIENAGPDNDVMATADNFIEGVNLLAVPSGEGAPGGGGSGGSILLIGKVAVDIASGGTLSAAGGPGGTSGVAGLVGGAGGQGRITLMTFGSAAADASVNGGATVSPAATTNIRYNPTVDEHSVGQSEWIDLFVTNTDFAPLVNGQPATPSRNDNFTFLTTPMGQGGAGLTQGVDFDATWEVQGALDLTPDADTATGAVGLTAWTDISNIATLNGSRYLRFRFRFFVRDGYPGLGLTATPLPQILDLIIPYATN